MVLTKRYSGDQMKEDEKGEACGGEGNCIHGFGEES